MWREVRIILSWLTIISISSQQLLQAPDVSNRRIRKKGFSRTTGAKEMRQILEAFTDEVMNVSKSTCTSCERASVCMRAYACIRALVFLNVYAYPCSDIRHSALSTSLLKSLPFVYAFLGCTHANTRAHTHTLEGKHARTHARMHARTHARARTHTHTHISMRAHTCTHTHANTLTGIGTHTHTRTHAMHTLQMHKWAPAHTAMSIHKQTYPTVARLARKVS
jgi:hypothetical protein